MTEAKGRINQYVCFFGHTITTINFDEGTTPMSVPCFQKGCSSHASSRFYLVDQNLKPDYEWYKPKKLPRGPMREHVQMGGLLLRKIHNE